MLSIRLIVARRPGSWKACKLPSLPAFRLTRFPASQLPSFQAFWQQSILLTTFHYLLIRSLQNQVNTANNFAGVVKLVDALDSKSSGPCVRASSILASGTSRKLGFRIIFLNPNFLCFVWMAICLTHLLCTNYLSINLIVLNYAG